MSKRRIPALGTVFGQLTVVGVLAGPRRTRMRCRCSCGNETVVAGDRLFSGGTKSCGCLRLEGRPRSHGESNRHLTAEYRVWLNMRARCTNSRASDYKDYGGRGIKVCARWDSFEYFLADMGRRPSSGHSIDRKDNDGDYTPENCRWATRKEQAGNKRNNRILSFKGKTQTLAQWARDLGVRPATLSMRLNVYGWSVEKTLSTRTKEPLNV